MKSQKDLLPLAVIAGFALWWFTREAKGATPSNGITPVGPSPATREERRRILLAIISAASLATLEFEKANFEKALLTGNLSQEVEEDLRWGLSQIQKRITEMTGGQSLFPFGPFKGKSGETWFTVPVYGIPNKIDVLTQSPRVDQPGDVGRWLFQFEILPDGRRKFIRETSDTTLLMFVPLAKSDFGVS